MRITRMNDSTVPRAVTALVAVAASVVLAGCAGTTPSVTAGGATPAAAPTSVTATPRTVVMIIRHGEKPDGSEPGVDATGDEDDSSLTTVGWERAHRLVGLFDPAQGDPQRGLARPTTIYAAGATDGGEGQRTRETVAPLADALGVPVSTDYGRGEERKLVKDVTAQPGVTLISWQHGGITDIAEAFPHVTPDPPQEWPDDRFDVVWVLTRTADGWDFAQVPELVLPRDRTDVFDD